MKNYLLFFVAIISVCFIGCKTTEEPKPMPTLSLDALSLDFDAVGGEKFIGVESNSKWEVNLENNVQWLTFDVADGKVTLRAEENTSEEARETKVIFTVGDDLREEVAVRQAAAEVGITLSVSPSEIDAVAVGGEYRVNVACEREWEVLPFDGDWLEILPMYGSSSVEMTITAQRNTTTEPREIVLTIQTKDKSGEEIITIKQDAFDDSKQIVIEPAKTEISYLGDEENNGLKMWNFSIKDKTYIESGFMDGRTMEFSLATGSEFNDGLPTGEFAINASDDVADFKNGDIVKAGYKNAADYFMTSMIESGELSVNSVGNDSYEIKGEFFSEDGASLVLDYVLDLNDESSVTVKDESFQSGLDGSYVQDVSEVMIINKGDIMHRGVNVWDVTIWGDGATKGTEFTNDSKGGTVTTIRFYTPKSQTTPDGDYTVYSDTYRYKYNTIEPGHEIAYAESTGSWIRFYKDWVVDSEAPAVEGDMSIKNNGDGTYSLSYDFLDDSPEPSNFKADYNGVVDVVDIDDTGDFELSKTKMYYVDDKYGANSWILHLETKDYVESGYKNGEVMEFVLNVKLFDEFDMDFEKCEWVYSTEGNKAEYAIQSGTVTTYKDGVPTSSNVTAGKIANHVAWYNNYSYFIEVVGITTENGSVYDMYHYSNLPREDITESELSVVDITDFTVANLAYYGTQTQRNYSNWQVTLIDKSGAIFTILDLYVEASNGFEDGIPSGTYNFIENNDEEGIWNTRNVRVTYFDEYTTISSGSLVVEQLADGKYNFTADFELSDNDATMIGTLSGIEVNYIDNRVN